MHYLAITLALIFTPSIALANSAQTDVEIYRASVVTALLYLAYAIAFVMGLFALKTTVSNLMSFKEDRNRKPNAGRAIVLGFLLSGVLLNPSQSINFTVNSLGINSNTSTGYCFAYDASFLDTLQQTRNQDVDNDTASLDATTLGDHAAGSKQCFSEPLTRLQQKAGEKIDNNKGLWDKLSTSNEFKFLIGLIQVIAVFFYFNAWFKVWAISEGKGGREDTYGSQAITIIASSFVYNIPATISLLLNTAEKIL